MTEFLRILCENIAGITPFGVLCFFPLAECFRFSVKKTAWATALVALGVSVADVGADACLCAFLGHGAKPGAYAGLSHMLAAFLFFAWYAYAVRAIWQKKAVIYLFALESALFYAAIADYVFTLMPAGEEAGLCAGAAVVVSLIISGVYAPPMCLFLKVLYMPQDRIIGKKEFLRLNIPLLILFVCCLFAFTLLFRKTLSESPHIKMLYFGLLLMVFLLCIVIVRMLWLINDKKAANERYVQAQNQIDIQGEQCRRITDDIESVRKQRHDLRLHMATLRGFLANGETDKAIVYLDQYLENQKSQRLVRYSENPVVNILVSHYADIAKESKIAFSTRIQISGDLSVQDTDLSAMLGNLLANAICAAQKLPASERAIKLGMMQKGNMLVLTVDNSFNGKVQKKGGAYLSTKPEHSGLGLSILSDLAKKYHGGVEFRHDKDMFYSSVMLRLD